MKRKFFLSLLVLLSPFIYAQNMRIIPSFAFDSSYNYIGFNKDSESYKQSGQNVNCHNFSTKLDGTLRIIIPKTYINADYTFRWNLNSKIDFNVNKLWAKFSLGDWVSLQIGRYCMNWSEGLTWNVSDFINNKPEWNNNNVIGKDGLDININLPFDFIPININIASLFFNDIKDSSLYFLAGVLLYPFELKFKCGCYYDKYPSAGFAMHTNFYNLKISLDTSFLFGQDDNSFQFKITPEVNYYLPIAKNHELNFLMAYLFQSDGFTKEEGTKILQSAGISNISAITENIFKSYRQYLQAGISYSYKDSFYYGAGLKLNLEDFSGALMTDCKFNLLHNIGLSPAFIFLFGNDNTEAKALPYNYMFSFSVNKKI